jgi:hypothetical protein
VKESIEEAGFRANLVSNADDVGVIHKTIIQNLYDNRIVVCDLSGKNPNVMFELGMRLAFDKPTIIIKDEKTTSPFDTAPIEHIEYPRDLRFSRIVDFKVKLTEKIIATDSRAKNDPNFTTFLKHFGEFTVAKLDKKEVSGQEFIIEELRSIRSEVQRMGFGNVQNRDLESTSFRHPSYSSSDIDICLRGWSEERSAHSLQRAIEHSELDGARIVELEDGYKHLLADAKASANVAVITRMLGGTRADIYRPQRHRPGHMR